MPPCGLTPIQLKEAPFGQVYAVAGNTKVTSPGHVGPDEVSRDDVAVGPGAIDVDAIVVAPRDDVPLAHIVDAVSVGTDPVAGGAGRDRHAAAEDAAVDVAQGTADRLGAVVQSDGSREVSPEEVARDGIAIRALARDPDAGEQIAAEIRFRSAASLTPSPLRPDEVLAGSAVDFDPSLLGSACVPVGSVPRKLP